MVDTRLPLARHREMAFVFDALDFSSRNVVIDVVVERAHDERDDHAGEADDADLVDQSCELTGTGNALLYGYFDTTPVRVAELDKTNANNVINDHPLAGIGMPSDWAFSFWGGDFYLYAAPGDNLSGNSSVIHYSPSTGAVDQSYVADTGMTIIGAGVSTCAPITMPM